MLSLSSRIAPADTNAHALRHILTATVKAMPIPTRRPVLSRRSPELSDNRDHRVTGSAVLFFASAVGLATMRSTRTLRAARSSRNTSISVRDAMRIQTSTTEEFSELDSLLKPYATLFGGHGDSRSI